MLAQKLLLIMRTILAPTIRVMDAAFRWLSERNGHLQRSDRKITFHTIADRPADHPPRMQVQDHSKIQPTFARPDIADVSCPFLIWFVCSEVSIQQVRSDVELVIAICRRLVLARPAIAAKAEARLFLDVC